MANDETNDTEHAGSKEGCGSDEKAPRIQDPVSELDGRIEDLTDTLLRLQADFDNYTKRVAKEWNERAKTATEGLVRDLLPVLDTFDKAFEDTQKTDDADHDRKGLEGIHRQLLQIIQRQGLREIRTDCGFDPFEHEALMRAESEDADDGKILEVYQKGYSLGGKVIRPAKVKVAKRTELVEITEPDDDNHDNPDDERSE
ncbi:MAG: nucleotide exchange factor GrpE [Thermoplasmata archaeon]|nr:nucleotide exchange factor GrpE [Thermoplasmata archaeon]